MPRPLTVILTLLVLACLPGTASATILITDNRQAEVGPTIAARSSSQGALRLLVERGGTTVLDSSGEFAFAHGRLVTMAGDVVKVFQPATAPAPTTTVTLDDRPTIDRVCAGAIGFTGKLTNSAGSLVLGAQTYNPFTSRSADQNYGRAAKVGSDGYGVQLRRPARLGEYAVVTQGLVADQTHLVTSVSRLVEICTTAPPSADDALVTFRRRDLKLLSTGVRVRLRCAALSTVPCAGAAALTSGKKVVGSKAFELGPGTSKQLTVKLTKRARKALRRRGRLRVKLTVATKNQAGALLTKSASVTLKHKHRRKR